MATIEKFEDLRIWKEARELSKWLFETMKQPDFSRDFELKNQSNRSMGSVMDNIAEGFERNGNREFIQFLAIAKGSLGEFRSQLYRMYDRDYISSEQLGEKQTEAIKLSEGIGAFMQYLAKSKIKGTKFKERVEKRQ